MPRRSKRKLWTPKPKPKPKAKPKAAAKQPAKVVWKPTRPVGGRSSREVLWVPEREKSQPASVPNKKRKLADLSKMQPARHEHGWRFEEYVKVHGKPGRGRRPLGARWTCDYQQADGTWGCKSFVWQHEPGPGQFHSWDCPYWHLEGKDLTPF